MQPTRTTGACGKTDIIVSNAQTDSPVLDATVVQLTQSTHFASNHSLVLLGSSQTTVHVPNARWGNGRAKLAKLGAMIAPQECFSLQPAFILATGAVSVGTATQLPHLPAKNAMSVNKVSSVPQKKLAPSCLAPANAKRVKSESTLPPVTRLVLVVLQDDFSPKKASIPVTTVPLESSKISLLPRIAKLALLAKARRLREAKSKVPVMLPTTRWTLAQLGSTNIMTKQQILSAA